MQWYSALAKPSWTPALATIGLIWQILYPETTMSASCLRRLALLWVCSSLWTLWSCSALSAADIVIVADGQPRAAVFVSERIWDDAAKNPEPSSVWKTLKPEDNRRRLRESVRDLVGVVERMSGAKLPIEVGAPKAGDGRIAILVGELAAARFGPPAKTAEYQQGLRIVVGNNAVGLIGESDLATSYATYTLLDQLGCRWFLPSTMGEVLPISKTITLKEQDVSTAPYTIYRGLWYCDNDFARRNRMGGMAVSAGHFLEHAVPKELRAQHPEIKAIIGGKPHEHWIKWTHPLVAETLTNKLLDILAKEPETKTLSLSPDDGATWDESDDAKFDAGDYDPSLQTVAKADRLMVLCNRIAAAISPKYPDVKFGVLAYVDYTRPPVREKPHPAIVPQIAPITFSRAHPLNDPGEPNNKSLQHLVAEPDADEVGSRYPLHLPARRLPLLATGNDDQLRDVAACSLAGVAVGVGSVAKTGSDHRRNQLAAVWPRGRGDVSLLATHRRHMGQSPRVRWQRLRPFASLESGKVDGSSPPHECRTRRLRDRGRNGARQARRRFARRVRDAHATATRPRRWPLGHAGGTSRQVSRSDDCTRHAVRAAVRVHQDVLDRRQDS